MNYIELSVPVSNEEHGEIVIAELAEWPFESFSQSGGVMKAYIPAGALAECKEQVDEVLARMSIAGARYVMIEAQNWNALWESNFEPVDVDGLCMVRAPFHEPPRGGSDVVIMPKMSFGTGHHATTWLMVHALMERDVKGMRVLDLGSGTGVLAIVAALRGAAGVDAVDIDEWAFENAGENIAANGVADRVNVIMGDVASVAGRNYDLILANINLNILLRDMDACAAALKAGGEILFSGIFVTDLPTLSAAAAQAGLTVTGHTEREGWACLAARK